jgi:hypothetical protein
MRKLPVVIVTIAVILVASFLMGQTAPPAQISARELYYKPARKTSSPPAAERSAARGAAPSVGVPKDSGRGQARTEPESGPRVVLVSDTALAMRYRLLKRTGTRFNEVDTDTTFATGDYIKIAIATNAPAHVYIAQIGSSGKWNILFPDQVPDANRTVKEYSDVELPQGNFGFQFDSTPGVEQVFIAASRQPIADLEQVISSRKSQPPEQRLPANSEKGPQLVVASVPTIDDSLIAGLRLQARDLVVQKVDTTSGGSQEHAVYVATAPDSNADLVIADLKLNHQR